MINFNYKWNLTDLENIEPNGYKVFSCFAGGGGSSQGYKMAGYDVIGCNEIDPQQMEIYKHNLKPKYSYLEDIRTFRLRDDLPKELFELDILDASFPCSLFSSANLKADDKKGKEVKFREGQSKQILDDLVFETIKLIDKIKPKICVLENVKGLLQEKNKWYVEQIYSQFDKIGYRICHHLINCADLGVPQKRQRVFFFAIRNDIDVPTCDVFSCEPYLNLDIKEKHIAFREVYEKRSQDNLLPSGMKDIWECREFGDADFVNAQNKFRNTNKRALFNFTFIYKDKVCNTLNPRNANVLYDFKKQKVSYVLGMSVPPLAMYRISKEIQKQWLQNTIKRKRTC